VEDWLEAVAEINGRKSRSPTIAKAENQGPELSGLFLLPHS